MEAKLSIVIPVYNRRNIVGRTLSSVKCQSLRPLEIIIVDNNSTDGSYGYLRQWKVSNESADFKITLLREHEKGAAAARNRGLGEVTTPWVMFFDSDDCMLPEHCARAMKAAEDNPDSRVIGWDTELCLPGGKIRTGRFASEDMMWNNIFHGSMATQRWMAETSLVREAGGWNPKVFMWNDIELGTRILAMKPVVTRISGAPTVRVFHTPGSITEARKGFADNIVQALSEISASLPEECRRWIPFKLVLGASYYGMGHPDSRRLVAEALETVPDSDKRLLKLLVLYLKHFKRGGADLVSVFLNRHI